MRRVIAASAVVIGLAGPTLAQEVDLTVSGDNAALEDFLEGASLLFSLPEEAVAQDYVAAANADYRNLLTALYARAFYAGTISIQIDGREAAGIAPLDAPRQIGRIVVRVDPGPRYVFRETVLAPLPPDAKVPDGFAPGERAEAEIIRSAALAGVESWRAVGHAKADVADQDIVARHSDDTIDARVTLAPGPRLTFGPLIVEGNEDVRTGAIQNIVGLPTGEVYSPEELEAAAQRLRQTGAFASVAVREGEIGPGNTLPITFVVAEALPRRIGAGVEYSTVEGLAVSAYWMHRNFFGAAERFRIEGEVTGIGGGTGGTDYAISTSLTIPAIYGPHLDLLATASVSREDEPDYLLDKASAEVVAVWRVAEDLTVSGGVGWLTAREETETYERRYTLLTLPLSATLDRRDDPTNANNGYYIDAEATPFFALDGGENGAWVYLDGRAYRSFGPEDRFTIAVRGQVGSVLQAPRNEVPADFLFFSGGSATVRGQEYKSLGVTRRVGGEDLTLGGLSYAGAQLEARYGVTEAIGIVGFYDAGFVGETSVPLEEGEWHSGVGIGVRYNTGIGPIRLDVATPADGEDAFGRVEVYIGIGQAF